MSGRFSLVHVFFFLMLIANSIFCFQARKIQAAWQNVPPAPTEIAIKGFFMGDRQFAYRASGMMLQNLGDTGGRAVPFQDYNYHHLADWFALQDRLDPVSNFVPFLAAYYFSGTQNPAQLPELVDYLAEVGSRPEGEKWRWLLQAIFLARFRMNDLDRALDLASRMASQWHEGRPVWMKQMPAFILSAKGDKAAAYALTVKILQEDADKLDPSEVNFLVSYICERLLDPPEAEKLSVCASVK